MRCLEAHVSLALCRLKIQKPKTKATTTCPYFRESCVYTPQLACNHTSFSSRKLNTNKKHSNKN